MNPFGEIHEDRDIDYDYDPSDELEDGICLECGEECKIITIDEGIGPYEFWGAKGVHHEYVQVSDCCHADYETL